MLTGNDIGIDLGTASVIIYSKGQGIVLQEPSIVAVDENKGTIVAIGEDARKMLGKTPENIVAIKPLKDGVISDFEITEKMIRYFIEKSVGQHWMKKPKIAVCVPSKVTDVERRAVEESTRNAGAGQVYIIEEPIAAAMGAGIDITRACGSMIVDIGGGTTDIAVISLGGIVVSTSIKVAGNSFDNAISRYMRKKHNILIGEVTAENLKIIIGTACKNTPSTSMDIKGRNITTGLPMNITVTSDEIYEALRESVTAIIDAIRYVLERTPPELSSDIADRGIVMTGGGSLLSGLNEVIGEKTGLKCVIADDPVSCVAVGTGRFVEYQTEEEVEDTSIFGKIRDFFNL